ncbi:LOW QUALITY PROTEIN: uncharacterized protein LOC117576171 [Drosophila albomicans]|uniref:LOW QUALITY PROTEIN: uncharacterized protein LOC117576171 n=1 Tax=Drosophila albomicans TaxID=7291 RepID=A0A6P8XTW5_DROAB|nr:LOW QUALITY PROTEIN: uncharacterized protein LOC117576171 [Drosophila albomicans]
MNYLIQRGKVRQQAIGVPEGLPELLSDITREVLRCQPTKECLCQFIIDYLHSVIVTREKAMVARSILDRALRQVDSIISDLCVCDLTKEKSDMMSQVLEDCFRNFLEKRRCEMRRDKKAIQFADVDMLEELIQKCGFSEEELDKSRPTIESAYKRFVDAYMAAAVDTKGTEILYQYFRDRELKRIEILIQKKAATTIQAAWRGYAVRRTLAQHVCTCICTLDNKDEEEAKQREAAARTIQRFFKKMLLRQSIKPMGDPCEEKETPRDSISAAAGAPTGPPTETIAATVDETEATKIKIADEDATAISTDEASPAAAEETPPADAGEVKQEVTQDEAPIETVTIEESHETQPPTEVETSAEQPPPTEEAVAPEPPAENAEAPAAAEEPAAEATEEAPPAAES